MENADDSKSLIKPDLNNLIRRDHLTNMCLNINNQFLWRNSLTKAG